MSKEAMKLALEALKKDVRFYKTEKLAAIKSLEEALAKQEEPLPPVEIGVDVTSDGASVVAFYRRPDAVMEMFYSQFHPLAKQEQQVVSLQCAHCQVTIDTLNDKVMSLLAKLLLGLIARAARNAFQIWM